MDAFCFRFQGNIPYPRPQLNSRKHFSRTSHHALFVEAGDAPHLCLVHPRRVHNISYHSLVNWMEAILKIHKYCQLLLYCLKLAMTIPINFEGYRGNFFSGVILNDRPPIFAVGLSIPIDVASK